MKQGKDRTRRITKGDIIFSSADNKKIFNIYLKEIDKYKVLTKEEEVSLFKRLKDGDNSVIEIIVKHNLKFVVTVAKKYQDVINDSTLTLEDLVCEGNAGLLTAIDRYDYTKDLKFLSYAIWYIKEAILKCIGKNIKAIRMGGKRYSLLTKLKRLESDLEQMYGRNINDNELLEIAKIRGVFRNEYDNLFLTELRNNSLKEKSLNIPFRTNIGDETTLIDILENNNVDNVFDVLETKELGNFINKIFSSKKIPSNIVKVFEMYYGLNGETPRNALYIAKVLNISEAAVTHRLRTYTQFIKRHFKKEFSKLNIDYKDNSKIEFGLID